MVSSNFPNRPFRLEEYCPITSQTAWNTGNSSLVHSELWIRKNSYSPTYSGSGSSYQMYIKGALVGSNGNFGYDFRNSDQLLLHASDNWFGHDGEGNMHVAIDGYANVAIMGYTEVHSGYWAPRIAQPASAPTMVAVDQPTTNSLRVVFSGNDLRGGSLDHWEYQIAENSGMSTNASIHWSNGTSVHTGLTPGKEYFFRARAVTNVGAGSWSSVMSAKTLAAVYESNGVDTWRPVEVYESDGNSWRPVEVYYSNGTAYVSPLSI
ncbi:minor tail protein [Microbacterium phage BAjuniper]|nr:minor tail protein [Microbacterium phage BAjuniper]